MTIDENGTIWLELGDEPVLDALAAIVDQIEARLAAQEAA